MYEEFEEGYVRGQDAGVPRDAPDGSMASRRQPPRRGGIGKVVLILVLILVLVGAGFGGAVLFLGGFGKGAGTRSETTGQKVSEGQDEGSGADTEGGDASGSAGANAAKAKAPEGRLTGGSDWGWGGATTEDRARVLERAQKAVGTAYSLGGEMALLRECWGPEGVEFPMSLGGEGRGWGLFDELYKATGGKAYEARYVSAGDILVIGDAVSDKSVNVATVGIYVGGGEMVCCLSPEVAQRAGLDSGVVLLDVDSAGGYSLASSPVR